MEGRAMRSIAKLLGLAVIAAMVVSSSAQASTSVGINFSGGSGNGGTACDPCPLAAADVTGVAPQSNWNNEIGGTGGPAPLVDSTGAATGATVTWGAGNTWSDNVKDANPLSANATLLNNYLDAGTGTPRSVTVTGLLGAFPGASTYDVYVYMMGAEAGFGGGDGRSDYTIGSQTQTVIRSDETAGPAFVLATFTTAGDYIKFNIPAAGSFTLVANANAGNFRSPVDGIQIVAIPEPSTFGLFAVGALSLLGVIARMRRKS
jgi:hypothetical protein